MQLIVCSLNSFEGQFLTGHPDYQGMENKYFESIVYDISCGSPAPGYSLSGNVPPNLVCETPSSTSTRIIANPVGQLFPDDTVLGEVVKQWELETLTFPFPNSDQGSATFTPRQTGTNVTKTFDFNLVYTGISDGAPCTSTLPLRFIVMIDWEYQSTSSSFEINKLNQFWE
jgi:hypothetical protein